MTKFASRYEDEFARLVMGHSQKVVEIDRQAKQRELSALNTREREIDNLFNRMYEDNASGRRSPLTFSAFDGSDDFRFTRAFGLRC
jgi:hypothetical protein